MAEFVGLHIDMEAVYIRNQKYIKDIKNYEGRLSLKGGLLVNSGDNLTKKEIEIKKKENIKLFGLSCDYFVNLKPPKAKTKEWLKVLTLEQIMNDKTRFSTSQKIHQLEILRIGIRKKLKAILKF